MTREKVRATPQPPATVEATAATRLAPPGDLATATGNINAWAEVDCDALADNVRAIRSTLTPVVDIIAVIKANAYGHGVIPVARVLEREGVERFGVASVSEARDLRAAGISVPIVVLDHVFPSDAELTIANDIECTVHSRALADAFSVAATALGRDAIVHIKVDTGLHRFGNSPADAVDLANYARSLPGVRVQGLWTHLANADEVDDAFTTEQLNRFRSVREQLDWVPYCHIANSAGTLRRPELHFNGVRPGLAIYGICPPNCPDPGLRPALSLKARLARVQRLEPGEGLSYGLTWRAARPSIVGLVPVGYGDGWRRALGNTGSVLVNGQRCPMVGRVCMDQFLVDLTDLPGSPVEGDEVVLLGSQGNERIDANEIAELTGTISWEVVAALLPRIPRIYHRGGIVEDLD